MWVVALLAVEGGLAVSFSIAAEITRTQVRGLVKLALLVAMKISDDTTCSLNWFLNVSTPTTSYPHYIN